MENPVVRGREPQHAYIYAFACCIADLYAVAGLGEQGRGLAADLDAYVVQGAICAVGYRIAGPVQDTHCGRNLFADILVKAFCLGVDKDDG